MGTAAVGAFGGFAEGFRTIKGGVVGAAFDALEGGSAPGLRVAEKLAAVALPAGDVI